MNFLFPQITVIVIEIDALGHCAKFDSYALTEIGAQVVKTFARTKGLGSELHSNCSNAAFYYSTLPNIEVQDQLPLTVTNFFPGPIPLGHEQCKACSKNLLQK